MIYMNWYHQNLPRILGALSFLINPYFIWLVLKRSKVQVGNYKYLLVMFSVFDVFYSISEILTPLGVQGNSHGFVVFISDGPFFEFPLLGQHVMSNRCGFIGLSYALLMIHFGYRFLALFSPYHLSYFFKSIGISIMAALMIFYMSSWTLICQNCLAADEKVRGIIAEDFYNDYGVSSEKVPMLAALYWNVETKIQVKSWLGIGLLTLFSCFSMSVYLVLGYKITMKIRFIKANSALSPSSLKLQRQLFKTLIVQTCIPIFASFLPTVISWYAPIFGINIGWWNTNVATVALAAFPFVDPLAVILLFPSFRRAVFRKPGATVDVAMTSL